MERSLSKPSSLGWCFMITFGCIAVKANYEDMPKDTTLKPVLNYPQPTDEYVMGLSGVYGIVPNILPHHPPFIIKVQYARNIDIEFSRVFFPLDLKRQPLHVEWRGPYESYFTLLMIGLANPTLEDHNTYQWLHWMVGNIHGTHSMENNKTIAAYVPPNPGKDTGMHRYIFVVYQQEKKIVFPNKPPLGPNPNDKRRANFSCANFARKYSLGEPVGFNFFQSEYWGKNSSKTKWNQYDVTPGDYWITDLDPDLN